MNKFEIACSLRQWCNFTKLKNIYILFLINLPQHHSPVCTTSRRACQMDRPGLTSHSWDWLQHNSVDMIHQHTPVPVFMFKQVSFMATGTQEGEIHFLYDKLTALIQWSESTRNMSPACGKKPVGKSIFISTAIITHSYGRYYYLWNWVFCNTVL